MVYNYTKPRVPIAAQYGSPGPAYALPSLFGYREHDPRSVHTRQPAYPFGVQHADLSTNCGPGPAKYYPDTRVHRDGPDGSPRYSLYGRRKDLEPFKTPGPGTYSTDAGSNRTSEKSPAYSFGATFPPLNVDSNPAPNAYCPPSLIGRTAISTKRQAPAYTIYSRSKTGGFYEDFAKTPGPGTYQATSPDQYKIKQPVYSMIGRNMAPGDTTQKPGPGAHCPEKVNMHIKQNPRFSFGIRHSEYEAPLILATDDF